MNARALPGFVCYINSIEHPHMVTLRSETLYDFVLSDEFEQWMLANVGPRASGVWWYVQNTNNNQLENGNWIMVPATWFDPVSYDRRYSCVLAMPSDAAVLFRLRWDCQLLDSTELEQ